MKTNLKPGDRVGYAAKFLRNTGQFTGSAPQRRGTVASVGTDGFARVHWDDFEASAAQYAELYGEDFVEDARANGSLVTAISIAKVGARSDAIWAFVLMVLWRASVRLIEVRTERLGVVGLDWWFPEAGLVLWVGGVIRWKMWGSRRGWRNLCPGRPLMRKNRGQVPGAPPFGKRTSGLLMRFFKPGSEVSP